MHQLENSCNSLTTNDLGSRAAPRRKSLTKNDLRNTCRHKKTPPPASYRWGGQPTTYPKKIIAYITTQGRRM